MKIQPSLILWAASLALGGFAWAGPAPDPVAPTATAEAAIPSGWVANTGDNICGIANLKKVSNPALVDFPALLDSTPQIKRMKKEKIDPDSVEGKLLRKDASVLITKKCQVVRRNRGHCGIWKAIRHEDGRIVPDVTEDVRSLIYNEE